MLIFLLCILPVALAGFYVDWQLGNLRAWRRAKAASPEAAAATDLTVALLVPYRNEADNLPQLLADVRALNLPNIELEVLFIDDHSEDESKTLVDKVVSGGAAGAQQGTGERGARLRSLALADHLDGRTVMAYKKEALAYAVGLTTAEVIVTTDADCRLPEDWLHDLTRPFRRGVDVVLGPVLIAGPHNPNLLTCFQGLDLAAYQLYTAGCVAKGAPTLANGACFAFRRALFGQVGGYRGLDHFPSGDDVLLLHRFAGRPQTRFAWALSDPVLTRPVPTWAGLWRQRIRWASKAGEYVCPALKYGQALAFLTALGIVIGLVLTPIDGRFFAGAFLAWTTKAVVDFLLLHNVTRTYGQQKWLRWYPVVQLVHPFYLVAVGSGALLGVRSEWKGR